MEGKELIERMLDLLVEMAEHCINKEKPKDQIKCKCVNCALSWTFGLTSYGCFLVEIVDNDEDFLDNLRNVCIENNIDCADRLNRLADIFGTECEEE